MFSGGRGCTGGDKLRHFYCRVNMQKTAPRQLWSNLLGCRSNCWIAGKMSFVTTNKGDCNLWHQTVHAERHQLKVLRKWTGLLHIMMFSTCVESGSWIQKNLHLSWTTRSISNDFGGPRQNVLGGHRTKVIPNWKRNSDHTKPHDSNLQKNYFSIRTPLQMTPWSPSRLYWFVF